MWRQLASCCTCPNCYQLLFLSYFYIYGLDHRSHGWNNRNHFFQNHPNIKYCSCLFAQYFSVNSFWIVHLFKQISYSSKYLTVFLFISKIGTHGINVCTLLSALIRGVSKMLYHYSYESKNQIWFHCGDYSHQGLLLVHLCATHLIITSQPYSINLRLQFSTSTQILI